MFRLLKQILVLIVFLLIAAGLGTAAYFVFKPEPVEVPAPEGPKDTIEVMSVDYIASGDESVDVIAKIKNPNDDYASSSFSYEFKALDSNKNIIASRKDYSYILSGQSKYIVEINLNVSAEEVEEVKIAINDVRWEKAENLKGPELVIKEKLFENPDAKGVAGRATGILVNEGNYDFDKVTVTVILYDNKNNIIGLGKTELRTIVAKEKRYFEINWNELFNAKVGRLEMEATTNTLDKDNVLRVKGGDSERFLQLNEE